MRRGKSPLNNVVLRDELSQQAHNGISGEREASLENTTLTRILPAKDIAIARYIVSLMLRYRYPSGGLSGRIGEG